MIKGYRRNCNEGVPANVVKTPCNSGYEFSSIVGYGEVIFIDDAAGKAYALNRIVHQQAGIDVEFNEKQTATVCVLRIKVTELCAKKKVRPQ